MAPEDSTRVEKPVADPSIQEPPGAGSAAKLDERPRRLYIVGGVAVAVGAVAWLLGRFLFVAQGVPVSYWDATWSLAGISFVNSVFVPVPGITAALLLSLSPRPVLGTIACLGAAAGSTSGAAVLLGLGHEGRRILRKRATHTAWARKTLAWSTRLATRWTYAAVVILLILQFIPKLVTLYAAILVHLRAIPFLAAVYLGVFLRNVAVLLAFALGIKVLGL